MGDRQRQREPFRVRLIIGLRTYGKEVLAAAVVVALVIGVAFGVNKFFYGFDRPQSTSSSDNAAAADRDAGGRTPEKKFRQSEDWRLILVNADHPLDGEFDGELTELRYGEQVDSRIYPQLQEMFDRMRAEGLLPLVSDGYHTAADHREIFEKARAAYLAGGHSEEEARRLAGQEVGYPRCSEHELGICVDITSETGDAGAEKDILSWLEENSWEYGFVRRYPPERSGVTGITGEHAHYRFVGTSAAKIMHDKGLTLEECLEAVQ